MKLITIMTVLAASTIPGVGLAEDASEGLSVIGRAVIEVPVDQVEISSTILVTADDAREARRELQEKTRRTLAFLQGLGFPRDSIKLSGVRLVPVHKTKRSGKQTVVGFHGYQDVEIVADDLALYDRFVDGSVEAGIERIWDVEFTRSDVIELRRKARIQAIQAARDKARYLAEAIDQQIGPATWIKEIDEGPRWEPSMSNVVAVVSFDPAAEAFTSSVEGQTIEVEAEIEASFSLSE